MNSGAQIRQQSRPRHLQQIETHRAWRRLQIEACMPSELQDLQIRLDQDPGRTILIQDDPVSLILYLGLFDALLPLRLRHTVEVQIGSGKFEGRVRERRFLGIQLELFVDLREEVGECSDRLRASQHKESRWIESVMEDRDELPLDHRLHVDHYVSAANQVDSGEWRVIDQVLPGENAYVAEGLTDLVALIDFNEVAP